MRGSTVDICGCFPTGRHYPGIADRIAKAVTQVAGLADEFPHDLEWMNASFAVIDFETTGLDPEKDRILEIGIVCFDGGRLSKRHNFLVNPDMPVPEEAKKIHGIGDEELAQAPKFEELFPDIVGHLTGRLPVAYNADFDRRFLRAEFARISWELEDSPPPALRADVIWIDPLVWVRELQKYEKRKKLTDVCERMGIPLEQAHRAAGDAEATGLVLLALGKDLPQTYSELIRIQTQYAAQQEAEMFSWRGRKG
ncbi:MAG: 3'-5' exonuclease [Myxococcales bacterium]|nr:3'-5' exonuclease [Myxococcales bacterium]